MKSVIFYFVLLLIPTPAFSETLPITKTELNIDWDGKWSHPTEWKASSFKRLQTQYGDVYLRFAHQGDYIYVLVDSVFDRTLDKNSDRAIICFDYNNKKSAISQKNDYCFTSALGQNTARVIQGGSNIPKNNYFHNIQVTDVIGVGGISDENDRYSKIPHTSYEFKIPIDLIGRTNIYGFYLGVYDQTLQKTITLPESIKLKNNFEIPSPSQWGAMYSPDRSLPEFPMPLLIVVVTMISIIVVSKVGFRKIALP